MSCNFTPKTQKLSYFFFALITTLFFSLKANAQCAGEDAFLTVCNITDPANQNIDLFSLLNGAPTAGGTWSDPLQTGGLDATTGILNVWNIHLSGEYTFNYTVANIDGCTDTTASIVVTVGGYSGITSPNGSVCSDDSSVNLFQFFVGDPPSPHLNGVWTDNDNTGALSNNIFNATAVEIGTYSFTYTMPEIGTCPATSSTAIITVHRAPEPGEGGELLLCETDDMTIYTNFDLFSLLSEADLNGQWSETTTTELASPFDSFVNVENIFNTQGPGTYTFTYTVYPTNPVCSIETETVEIIIEELIDLTGGTLEINSDICEDELEDAIFTAVLSQGNKPITDGTYQITVEIAGQTENIVSQFIGGIFTFELDNQNFPTAGEYIINITDIFDINGSQACENIADVAGDLEIFQLPDLENAILSVNPVCIGSQANIELSEAINVENGTYEITYSLSGENTATDQLTIITISNGNANFSIPANLIPNAGNTTITITNITNQETFCTNTANLSTEFLINELPDGSSISIVVDDICQNEDAIVALSGFGNMTNITLNYTISGTNQANNQTVTLNITSGNGVFTIPSELIPNAGLSTLTLVSLTDNVTTCSIDLNISDDFTINPIPEAPQANNAIFCESDSATIADLQPNGTNINWYASPNGNDVLENDTPLISGNYYVEQISGTTNCPSERTMITVTINSIQAPTLEQNGESFCGADNPTLQDLSANVNAPETLIWYDALTDGNQLENTELLQEGFTYYGYQFSSTLDCTSVEALAVTVTLTDCDDPDEEYGFFIPDGFSPNNDNVNDTFRIPDIEFLYPNFTLEIYNRYGNLMFTGNKNKPNWDGKNSDSSLIDGMAPNGVYFFVLHFNKDNISPKQGRLYLNR
ncbi:gliding motility-associated C-terminal domain-containing protein [Flavobacterium soli]|uniref:gliding motility-associated C-terminal domain-containing protein n=1 Tax=Flavobacterium soli TaxID=344881 RepID=UPI00040A87DF|nr:T9SS C-terminal target domain-containing protein [Flavobacterium soli]